MRHQLTLYGKPDCHLCHEAHALLLSLQREFAFSLHAVDITTDAALFDQYQYTIPVIVINSALELAAPIDERELRAVLAR